MISNARLGKVDYVIIGLTLIISALIGIKFRISDRRRKTTKEYLLAGKDMSVFPVIMSVTVTMLSAVAILGQPSESYRYGIQYIVMCIGFPIGSVLAAYIFLPVYFNCNVTTTYEFLELRFGKTTRYIISSMFLIQMILFMSVALYAPILALSAVTDLSLEFSVVVFGLVCTFYCAVGGLRAVIWTDVFQAVLMFLCLILVNVKGVQEAGGIAEIYKKSAESQRLNIFDFKEDFTKRYTFLNSFFRGLVAAFAIYGTSQIEVQRMLSMKSHFRAILALVWSTIPIAVLLMLCGFLGLVLYSIFYNCDPVADKANTGVLKYDQVVPYYIVTRFSSMPGVTGLCVAGIFSGSLSTISSALNSLASVTVMDFIKPIYKREKLSESRTVCIAKLLSLFYGILCIGMTFLVSKVDSIVAISSTILGIVEGPTLALFLVGVLTRKGTEKNVLFGFLTGITLVAWIASGIVFGGYRYPSLPLGTNGCLVSQNVSEAVYNLTSACEKLGQCSSTLPPFNSSQSEPFFLYKLSFTWLTPIGFISTIFFIFLSVVATGWRHNVIPSDSKCLSPVSRFWIKGTNFGKSEEQDTLKEKENFIALNKLEHTHTETKTEEV